MKDFEYFAPATIAEAAALLARPKAKALAGGTDLIVQLRENMREAEVVVDLKKIASLVEYRLAADGLTLGAAVPCYKMYDDAAVVKAYPALTDAAKIIGGWQIQSRASIGGNLCNSSPAADSIPALMALGAIAILEGSQGRREVPVREFCTGPGKNVIQAGELLAAIRLPAAAPRSGSAYERFIPRNEMDIAVVGVGSWLRLNAAGDRIEECRIALGAVGPTSRSADDAAASLVGQAPNEAAFAAAGELAKKIATPISDMRGPAEYRTHLVGVLVKRTLLTSLARAQGAAA